MSNTATIPQMSFTFPNVKSITENFERFHGEKPEVYKWFTHYAEVYLNKGFKRVSPDFLLHIVRHHIAMEKSENELYKINNNYSALYSRKLMADNERFNNFFETRIRKAV